MLQYGFIGNKMFDFKSNKLIITETMEKWHILAQNVGGQPVSQL
jgi:hypothetical protein